MLRLWTMPVLGQTVEVADLWESSKLSLAGPHCLLLPEATCMPQKGISWSFLDQAWRESAAYQPGWREGGFAHLLHSASYHSLCSACLGWHSQSLLPWPRSETPCAWWHPGDGTASLCGGCARRGMLLTLSPWPSLTPCWMCHGHLSGFAGWDRCSWGILHPSKSHLCCFSALLCSGLELAQWLCKAAITKPNVGEAVGWDHGGTSNTSALVVSEGNCVWLLCPGRAAEATCPFRTFALSHQKENWKWQLLQFPVLAWQGDGARCYSQARHLPTQQLWWENSGGGLLDSASLTFH